ncbi:unnamed protein product [Clonostachys rhizophaga]|uniref:Uncharacterized protein n=1 Tax=Clonostachys rhizophaga TaxID=160324 RepID=A0A9N9YD55_9HYPO|nr:unnamed protein product [Clonostachys rhizophaga]
MTLSVLYRTLLKTTAMSGSKTDFPAEAVVYKIKEIILAEAQRANEDGGDSKIDQLISDLTVHLLSSYTADGLTLSELEHSLGRLWYACIQGATHVPSAGHQQRSIVCCVLAARASGPLQYKPPPLEETSDKTAKEGDIVTFSDGRTFFPDLPLFSACLVKEFTGNFYQLSMIQQVNLATFVGRLIGVGVYDGPALCALSLFRAVLEDPRPLQTSSADAESEAPAPVGDLLVSLCGLIESSGVSFAVLSSRNLRATHAAESFSDFPHLAGPGELAMKPGSTPPFPSGYSPERWAFWAQRLRELEKCGFEDVKGMAGACLEVMYRAESNTNLLGLLADRAPVLLPELDTSI